jgi:GH25 family lysozyme M1 (1,4-beta-N-acetylmuramidase)
MHVTAGWTVGVAMMLLILGTPQVSRPEATLSFSSRYYYFCWNPGAQGHACSQRSSTKTGCPLLCPWRWNYEPPANKHTTPM